MNQMDYIVENEQRGERIGAAQQHQCPQDQNSSNPNRSIPAREGQHYDPVRESRRYYQTSGVLGSRHASNRRPAHVLSWGPPPLPMPAQQYSAYPEIPHSSTQSRDASTGGPYPPLLEVPWNESQGFGLNIFSNQSHIHQGISEVRTMSSTRHLVPITTASSSSRHREIGSLSQHPVPLTSPLPPVTQIHRITTSAPPIDQNLQQNYPEFPPTELRSTASSGQEQSIRGYNETQVNRSLGSSNSRRETRNIYDEDEGHGHGEDDNNDGSHNDMSNSTPRQQPELLFGLESADGARSLAALRGALAACKSVPSKHAMCSLEPVRIEELDANDLSCIICYNKFGVSNPEGLVETPLRLPKCKHVFGDICLKKWFEDSDSCPYCRDKLPSELLVKNSYRSGSIRATREQINLWILRARQNNGSGRNSQAGQPGRRSSNPSAALRQDNQHMVNRNPSLGQVPSNNSSIVDSSNRRRHARARIGNSRSTQEVPPLNSSRVMISSSQVPPLPGTHVELSNPGGNLLSEYNSRSSVNTGNSRDAETSIPALQIFPPQNWLSPEYLTASMSSENTNSSIFGHSMQTRQAQFERLHNVRDQMRRSLDDASQTFFSNLQPTPMFLSLGQSQPGLYPPATQSYTNVSQNFSTTYSSHQHLEDIPESDTRHRHQNEFYGMGTIQPEPVPRWSR